MPSLDIKSEIDSHELLNAIDQANRVISNRFDFKVTDSKITLDIPPRFINEESSPGLKRGGVLNVNRRTIQLSCPASNIPEEIVFDLDGLEIGDTIRISSVTLPDCVVPLITDRDFTVASVAAPTVVKEPEAPVEGEGEGEGEAPTEEGEDSKEASKDADKSEGKPEEKS